MPIGLQGVLLAVLLAAAATGRAAAVPRVFSNVSFHVSSFDNVQATNDDVAVFFAGYSVLLEDSEVWAGNVVTSALNVRTVFVVAGPTDAMYRGKEIDTTGLAELVLRLAGNETSRVTVMAHSSGAFVAYAFFSSLFAVQPSAAPRSTVFFCLDGGVAGLTNATVARLSSLVAVNARDTVSGIKSRNFDVMTNLANRSPPRTRLFSCAVQTQCRGPTGYNCMHDALINRWPHNSTRFDLHADYNTYNMPLSVQTDYLIASGYAPPNPSAN